MFTDKSTVWGLPPTDGKSENKHMVDSLTFSERLDLALALNGLDNKAFASHFGHGGQQMVNRWRSRGRVGQPSVPMVRSILPRTNMDWLQEGVGEPELPPEPLRVRDFGQSYAARLDPVILAEAVKVLSYDEAQGGPLPHLKYATLLLELYDKLAAGEDALALMAQLAYTRSIQGQEEHEQPAEGRRSARTR